MSKGYPTLWQPVVMARGIRQLMRSRCNVKKAPFQMRRGSCVCGACQEIRWYLFGSFDQLPRDKRGFVWRKVKMRDTDPLPRTESQQFIAAHFDRREPRTHPDLW